MARTYESVRDLCACCQVQALKKHPDQIPPHQLKQKTLI